MLAACYNCESELRGSQRESERVRERQRESKRVSGRQRQMKIEREL